MVKVSGTAHDAAPYQFLTFAIQQDNPLPARQAEEQEESLLTDKTIFEMEEVSSLDRKNSENTQEQEPEAERYEIEFDGIDDESEGRDGAATPTADEFILEEGQAAERNQPASSSMGFADLDISDLAPPSKKQAESAQQRSGSDDTPLSAEKYPAGLGDLNVAGLDLDGPAKLVSGSAGKRFLPSVKTGTALDNFEVDLGDLFSDNKK